MHGIGYEQLSEYNLINGVFLNNICFTYFFYDLIIYGVGKCLTKPILCEKRRKKNQQQLWPVRIIYVSMCGEGINVQNIVRNEYAYNTHFDDIFPEGIGGRG